MDKNPVNYLYEIRVLFEDCYNNTLVHIGPDHVQVNCRIKFGQTRLGQQLADQLKFFPTIHF